MVSEVLTLATLGAGVSLLEALQVPADDLDDEIDLAIEHVHFAHFGQVQHRGFEFAQRVFGLALQADHGENRDRKAQLRRIEFSVIAANDPVLFQCANAAQARRRGQADAMRQLDIGDSAFVLQFRKQATIDFVEIGHASPR